jgi:Flp pilus assembly protein TadD
LAKNDPGALDVEELLYAATLVNTNTDKLAIYKKVTELYAEDYRGHNNLGIAYFLLGNVSEARNCIAKALKLAPANADVNYNAGVIAMAEGNLDKAEEHFGKAAGTEANLSVALGTLYTMKGEYAAAKNAYGSAVSNNVAVQQIIDEDYAAARQTLARVDNPNATTAYLAAVIGARTNDRETVYANLALAVQRDAKIKEKALADIEFAKYVTDEKFQEIVK